MSEKLTKGEIISGLKVAAMEYLNDWEESESGLKLESELSEPERLAMQILMEAGLVDKRFNGGNTCYTIRYE